ncbi:YcaO-like family protein [Actinopolymorpha alba]|uniref:YcaO-like family protein n=1 Tax=Actinopolymorpha alba TaxID=533267 RepID=UPI00035C46E6|nr:YcaO-like family protein [Actinopolymorpha alba]
MGRPAFEAVTPEREISVRAAIERARRELAALDLDVEERVLGDTELPVTIYTARDRAGKVVSRSLGKGPGAQSYASGLFELIEHYYLDWRRRPYDRGEPAFLPVEELAAQPHLARANLVQRLRVGLRGQQLFSARYQPLDGGHPALNGGGPLWFPVFMRDPAYPHHMAPDDQSEFRSYRHFSSGIGTAAGVTTAEALLHAICELVEHDAMSQALAEWYVGHCGDHAERPVRLRRVDPATLSPETAAIFERVRARVDGELWLLDITGTPGIPAYLAGTADPTRPVARTGRGASLLPDYAAQRALTELLQISLSQEQDPETARKQGRTMVERLARWPWMARAARLDLTELAGRLPTVRTPLRASPARAKDVPALLSETLRRLAERDIAVYFRHAKPPDPGGTEPSGEATGGATGSGVVVVDVLAPGLELLDIVRNGLPLPPTGRLAHLLNS